jgi:hypothetical protein
MQISDYQYAKKKYGLPALGRHHGFMLDWSGSWDEKKCARSRQQANMEQTSEQFLAPCSFQLMLMHRQPNVQAQVINIKTTTNHRVHLHEFTRTEVKIDSTLLTLTQKP